LDINDWFAQHNPTAQAQLIERLQEAIERGYWQADAQVKAELAERLHQLEQLAAANSGYGTDSPASEATSAPPSSNPTAAPTESVQGQVLEKQASNAAPALDWQHWLGYLLLSLFVIAGAVRQYLQSRHLRELPR